MKQFSKITESNSPKFKLGLDVHGVIDVLPDFFSFLTNAIIQNGGEVHILTGGNWDEKMELNLKSLGIKWTHGFSTYDYLMSNNTQIVGEVQFPDGTIQNKFEDGAWDKVKGEYCLKNNISLHLDDTTIYNDFFKTPFARFWSHNGKPKDSKKDVRHLD